MRYYEIAILAKPLVLTYSSKEALEAGSVVHVQIKGRRQKGVVLQEAKKPSFKTLNLEPTQEWLSGMQMELAKFISTYYVCSIGEALAIFVPFGQKASSPSWPAPPSVDLSPLQEEAATFAKAHPQSLLFGDTGSGKTQVYMRLIAKTLAKKRRSIFLMPEISLTPQMQKRLEAVFGPHVVVWHSRLTKKRRTEALEKIRSGEAKIVAGPRSALFLPIEDLGLIVVDEEHDESYKSSSRPRINARDVALYMGRRFDIPVVLGSATPSVVTYHNIPSFRLKGSFHKARKRFLYDRGQGLTPMILEQIQKCLDSRQQTLIFVPTRAHFKYLVCRSCGQTVRCPFCDVGMSVHFDKHALVCHYCNFSQFIPSRCPECSHPDLTTKRSGTAQIAEALEEHFADAKIARLDKDSVSTQKRLEKVIEDFGQKKIDILVGTQMLSKGHDYPDVGLSVILDIDFVLAQADYRAKEKAISLMIQIAGRAGRSSDASVIVQTRNEEFFKRYQKDYELFLKEELSMRKDHYPPFVRMAQLGFSSKNQKAAEEAMERVARCLANFDNIQIVGAGPAAIEKIAGKYRYHILLKAKTPKELLQAIYACKNELCEVDMDPLQIM